MDFIAEDVLAQFHIRLFQLSYQTPLETGEQTVFHALKHHWCTVGCQDKLLAVLVQVVEDVEECILSLRYTGKFLNVINNQHVDGLIETDEIIEMVRSDRIGVLYLKEVC